MPQAAPAPWGYEDRKSHISVYHVRLDERFPRGDTICKLAYPRRGAKRGQAVQYIPTPDIEANARLIAQAPALLVQAKKLIKALVADRDCHYEGCSNDQGEVPSQDDRAILQSYDDDINELRAVIDAAEGVK